MQQMDSKNFYLVFKSGKIFSDFGNFADFWDFSSCSVNILKKYKEKRLFIHLRILRRLFRGEEKMILKTITTNFCNSIIPEWKNFHDYSLNFAVICSSQFCVIKRWFITTTLLDSGLITSSIILKESN